ncbi:penicillin-binding protein activator [Acinetobacter soli]|uniref:penicillin-binding protein activator n=1 Tax=Acinetobacter soli TaxID=487316 RepID=UPI003A83CFEF
MLHNKKTWLLMFFAAFVSQAHAEVIVILPETGPMARAATSIKHGFLSAYAQSNHKTPIKFVNSDQQNMKSIFRQHVGKKTEMVVGPLARQDVEEVMKLNPKVKVLALNEVGVEAKNVIQFSLSKQDDAGSMVDVLQKDNITDLLVLRQNGREADTELYYISLVSQFGHRVEPIQTLPAKLKKGQGLMLMGDSEWLNQLGKLPKRGVYAQAIAIEENKAIPEGLTFCDVPALYEHQWNDVYHAYLQKPEPMPYQRLIAFGGDAWMLTEQYVLNPAIQDFRLKGRTGDLTAQGDRIKRNVHCYQKTKRSLVVLK